METISNIAYKVLGDRELGIDVFLPEENHHKHTAVLMLHGGGWRHGDKKSMAIFGNELSKLGFVAVAVQYRLLDDSPWPAQIKDVKSAIRWLRKNAAEWDVDPAKIVVEGFSAGGQLALMAAGTPGDPDFIEPGDESISDAVAAVVSFFPPVEFTMEAPSKGIHPASIILEGAANEKDAKKASPIHLISASFPPTFLLHGTADKMVPHVTSQRLSDALEKVGVPVETHFYPGHTHEFVRLPSMISATHAEIGLFLERMVVDPGHYVQENLELNQFAKM